MLGVRPHTPNVPMFSLWRNLSIRSKLMTMLLLASLIGAGSIILIGFYTGQEAMTEQVRERLTAIRSAKSFEIESYMENVADEVVVLSDNSATRSALRSFSEAFETIQQNDTIDCGRQLSDWYEDFLVDLNRRIAARQEVSTFYPRTAGGCYLQTHYMVRNPMGADRRGDLDAAPGDRTVYAEVHREHNEWLRTFKREFGFYDAFLVDAEGTIVYSVAKEVDFATNLVYGPYRNSGLADLFEKVKDNGDLRATQLVDFTNYRPSYGLPAAFAGAPVVEDGVFLGMLAIQLPIDRINDIMNYGGEWEENGLGKTGETVLVDSDDFTLRSLSRAYLVDSAGFVDEMRANMLEGDWEAMTQRGPLLNLEVRSENIQLAAVGQDSIMTLRGYSGEEVLTAFGPLRLPGDLDWVITAEMDADEAYAAVGRFGRRMFLGLAAIVLVTVMLALFFTRIFMQPIERLTAGAERVKAGDTSTQVEVDTRDEIGQFTMVFNEMVGGIEDQKHEIAQQVRTNESILTAKFPPSVAERYRNGEENIVDSFDNVTVLFADIRRTEQLSELEPLESLHVLNTLVRAFNTSAERLGMEIIRPVADGYLCVCDMNSPRLDNTRRALEMSLDMLQQLRKINATYSLGLTMAVGIEHGSVSAGVIAESTNAYDVWGRAVDVTQRIAAIPDDNIIGVGPSVVELVGDRYRFVRGPVLHLSTGEDLQVLLLRGINAEATQGSDDEDRRSERKRRERTVRAEA